MMRFETQNNIRVALLQSLAKDSLMDERFDVSRGEAEAHIRKSNA